MSDITRREALQRLAALAGSAMIPGPVAKASESMAAAAAPAAAEEYVYVMGSRGMMRVPASEVAEMGNFAADQILSDQAGQQMISDLSNIKAPEPGATEETKLSEGGQGQQDDSPFSRSDMTWVVVCEEDAANHIPVEIATSRGISVVHAAAVSSEKPADLEEGYRVMGSFPAEDVYILEAAA